MREGADMSMSGGREGAEGWGGLRGITNTNMFDKFVSGKLDLEHDLPRATLSLQLHKRTTKPTDKSDI